MQDNEPPVITGIADIEELEAKQAPAGLLGGTKGYTIVWDE